MPARPGHPARGGGIRSGEEFEERPVEFEAHRTTQDLDLEDESLRAVSTLYHAAEPAKRPVPHFNSHAGLKVGVRVERNLGLKGSLDVAEFLIDATLIRDGDDL